MRLGAAREALGRAQAALADATARELLGRGDHRVVAVLDDASVELLRAVAARVTARPEAVALLAGRAPDGLRVLVARGAASGFDCGAFLARAAAAAGGRGGGRAERAEGRLPPSTDWVALVAAACAAD